MGIRTPDPRVANAVLYQLSYRPKVIKIYQVFPFPSTMCYTGTICYNCIFLGNWFWLLL